MGVLPIDRGGPRLSVRLVSRSLIGSVRRRPSGALPTVQSTGRHILELPLDLDHAGHARRQSRLRRSEITPSGNDRSLRTPAIAGPSSVTRIDHRDISDHKSCPLRQTVCNCFRPHCAQKSMLWPRWAPDRPVRAVRPMHPSWRSIDRGGASPPALEKTRVKDATATRTVAPIERRVLARPRRRQAICRKDHP